MISMVYTAYLRQHFTEYLFCIAQVNVGRSSPQNDVASSKGKKVIMGNL